MQNEENQSLTLQTLENKSVEDKTDKDVGSTNMFPAWVLNVGFIAGILFAGLCLVLAAYYMIRFQYVSSIGINHVIDQTIVKSKDMLVPSFGETDYQLVRIALATNMYISRVLLLSCGIFTGLSFGFMGFSLFLIGVKGNIDASLNASDKYKLQIVRLSPGLFVILCASLLIGVCATKSLPVELGQDKNGLHVSQKDTINFNNLKGLEKPDTTMPGN